MTLDGTDFLNLGFMVQSVNGGYNMPGRLSPFFYDWGDTMEPLFENGWSPRTIAVNVVYDPRRTASTVETITRAQMAATAKVLRMNGASGQVGEHNVVVSRILNHLIYGPHAKLTMEFQETVPGFNGVLPGSKSGGSYSLDGYSFKQFGIVISRVRNISGLGQAKTSQKTVYKTAQERTQYRAFHEFYLDCYLIGSGMTDTLTKLHNFQKVLSQEKVLPFVYESYNFDTLFTNQMQVTRISPRAFRFTLALNRL
jgi:hypothetical protein